MKKLKYIFWLLFITTISMSTTPVDAGLNSEQIILTLWHPYADDIQAQLESLIEQYNKNEEHIVIESIEFQNSGFLLDQLILQLTSERPQLPNLVMLWPHEAALIDLSNVLVDLSSYTALPNLEWVGDVGRDPFSQKTIAIPHSIFNLALVANLDALKELGYDAPPTTWEQFQQMACTFREKSGWSSGKFGVVWGFTTMLEAETWLAMSLSSHIDIFSEGQYQLDIPAMYESATTLKLMQDRGCLSLETERTTIINTFASGRALFALLPSTSLSILENAIKDHFIQPFSWQTFALPQGNKMLIYTPSVAVFDLDTASNDATVDFLAWFLSLDINQLWASALNAFPIYQESSTLTSFSQIQTSWEQMLNTPLIALPTIAGYDVVRLEIRFALERILANTTLPKDEIPALHTLVNQITRNFYGILENQEP